MSMNLLECDVRTSVDVGSVGGLYFCIARIRSYMCLDNKEDRKRSNSVDL